MDAPSTDSALLDGLNEAQRTAVVTTEGPVAIVAGPGSGKTRVLTHRVAYVIESGLARPWEVLAVTFTNKAAAEMRSRLTGMVGEEAAADMQISTFHALCARILRSNSEAAGLARGFQIADSDDSRSIFKKVLADAGVATSGPHVARWRSEISWHKNQLTDRAELAMSDREEEQRVAKLWEAYDERLAEASLVDFDDLLVRTVELLANDPQVLGRYQRRFRYVHVDEYQDTNKPQNLIANMLAAGTANICVVGDARQIIYSWRGAHEAAFADFVGYWDNTTVLELPQNYRSTPQIVAACQDIIEGDSGGGLLVTDGELKIGGHTLGGLWTDNPDGVPVVVHHTQDANSEARNIVASIHASIRKGNAPNTHAVLLRTNAQSQTIENELRSAGIPYRMVGAVRFYDRAEVRDALAHLRLVVNPADTVALARAVTAPRIGVGATALTAALEGARTAGMTPIDWVRWALASGSAGRARRGWEQFIANHEDVVAAARRGGPSAALAAISNLDGFAAVQLARGGEDPEERLANLDELVSAAQEFVDDPPADADVEAIVDSGVPVDLADTAAFLSHVALVTDADDDHPDAAGRPTGGGVWVITGHASKGSEFDSVWVAGCEDGLIPHERASRTEAERAEERRLLFVMASRAAKRLTFTWAERRRVAGQWRDQWQSPFLADLGPDVVHTDEPYRPPVQPRHANGRGSYGVPSWVTRRR